MKQHPIVFCLSPLYYSAFSGTDLDIRIRERGITQFLLTGVLSDICVLHTALYAYPLFYQLEIVKSS
ncbi:isochorismatase family protein, partial [Streptococcus pyogenes]